MKYNRVKTTLAVYCIAFVFLGGVQTVSAQDLSASDAAWLEKIDAMFQENDFRVIDTRMQSPVDSGPRWIDELSNVYLQASSVTLTVAAKHRTEYGMRVDLMAHTPTRDLEEGFIYWIYIAFNGEKRHSAIGSDMMMSSPPGERRLWPPDMPYGDIILSAVGAGGSRHNTPFPLAGTEFPPLYENGLAEADRQWERSDGKFIHPRDEIVEEPDGERLRIVETWSVRPLVEEYPEEKLLAARERGVNEAALEERRREALVSTYLDNPAYRPGVVFLDKTTGALTDNRDDENADPWLVLGRTRQTWDADGKDWLYRDAISYNSRGEILMKCVSRGGVDP